VTDGCFYFFIVSYFFISFFLILYKFLLVGNMGVRELKMVAVLLYDSSVFPNYKIYKKMSEDADVRRSRKMYISSREPPSYLPKAV